MPNKLVLAVVVIIVLASLIFYAWTGQAPTGNSGQTYFSTTTALSFNYPSHYRLTERDLSTPARQHYYLILTDGRLPEPPVGGEGPTAISIEIYQNNLDQQTIKDWVVGTDQSNYKLSPDGRLTEFTFDGWPAVSYEWDGLYRGETVAVATPKYVYAFSVTTLAPTDDIRRDFYRLLEMVDILE